MNSAPLDVLVIGAGLTGAVVAAHLAERGARVAVVDALQAGAGATRRAMGLATICPNAAHLAETSRGLDMFKHLAARAGVLLNSCSTLHLASTPARAAELRALATDRRDGAPIEWTERGELLLPGYSGGLIAHNSAQLDLAAFIQALFRHRAIQVREHTEVTRIEARDGAVFALCRSCTIIAARVVLATNACVGTLSPYLAESLRPARGTTWASRPMREAGPPSYPMPIVIDDGARILMSGADARLQAAAWSWGGTQQDEDPSAQLNAFLRRVRGGLLDQTEQWVTGITTTTDDGAPLVGRLDGDGAVLYALGLGPYGPAWSTVVAERIAELAR